MEITDSLRLVIPFGEGMIAYHTPISRDVYELNYAALNAMKSAMRSKGMYYYVEQGPIVAALTLRDEGALEAQRRGLEIDTRTPAFLAEIRRLTNILVPGVAGYDLLPVDAAISSGKLDTEDWAELESAIVFFTCLTCTAKKAERKAQAQGASKLLGGSITSLVPMEYAASLRTSTKATTGEVTAQKPATPLSIPC